MPHRPMPLACVLRRLRGLANRGLALPDATSGEPGPRPHPTTSSVAMGSWARPACSPWALGRRPLRTPATGARARVQMALLIATAPAAPVLSLRSERRSGRGWFKRRRPSLPSTTIPLFLASKCTVRICASVRPPLTNPSMLLAAPPEGVAATSRQWCRWHPPALPMATWSPPTTNIVRLIMLPLHFHSLGRGPISNCRKAPILPIRRLTWESRLRNYAGRSHGLNQTS